MRMIKITEEKKEKLGMHVEKILSAAGKLMQCIEALDDPEEDDEEFGERRSRMGMRGPMEDPDEMAERYGYYGNRRGRNGRYM